MLVGPLGGLGLPLGPLVLPLLGARHILGILVSGRTERRQDEVKDVGGALGRHPVVVDGLGANHTVLGDVGVPHLGEELDRPILLLVQFQNPTQGGE